MSKGKGKVIDLLSSSPPPEAGPSFANTRKHPRTSSELSPRFLGPVPKIEDLASHFYTRDGLQKHLISLNPIVLSKMLLSQVHDHQLKPRPSMPRSASKPQVPVEQKCPSAHCVYCHTAYDTRQNVGGCKVKHWGELEDVDRHADGKEWSCCGAEVSYVDWDSDCHADPVGEEPYCYTGRHWSKEIKEGDGRWWKGWDESGRTCADKGCDLQYERIMGAGRPSVKKVRRF